jgi:hypothetical protein
MIQTGRNFRGRLRLAWKALRSGVTRGQVKLATQAMNGYVSEWAAVASQIRRGFEPLETVDAAFVPWFHRRSRMTGQYPNGSDSVPPDVYGGWMENWCIYHVGRKPGASPRV